MSKHPKRNEIVTVVGNETGREITGKIVHYTPDMIIIEKQYAFDAKNVHFKEGK